MTGEMPPRTGPEPDPSSITIGTDAATDATRDGLGRERTVVARHNHPPAAGDPPTAQLGRERTRGAASPSGTTARTPATERAGAGGPPAAEPQPPTSATTLEDGWHLQGRKGFCTGQTWGDFELGGIIGEGGMGTVYRAMQRSLRRRVAIKVLLPAMAHEPRLLARFQIEATSASKLQTPHVVQVHAIGDHEGAHFYAMEFVDGRDLQHIIHARGGSGSALPHEQAVGFILQAAKGLAEAGRHGIVHRDIKPANLIVTSDGLLKIADFGIARIMGEHQLTVTGNAIGTPAYGSPEQGRGDRDVDVRSDLYSLGVVFYELVCGRKPFQGASANATIYQHCFEEPKLPKSINPEVPDEIQAVILRCLQKKPENRYQDADALIVDLEAIRTGQMLRTAIANYRLGTGADEAKREQLNWVQRHLRLVAGLILLAVSIGFGGGWIMIRAKQQELTNAQRGMMSVADQRSRLHGLFDAVAPMPEDADGMLSAFARLVKDGERDGDIRHWRAKLAAVTLLTNRLSALGQTRPTAAIRQSAREDYQALVAKIGATAAPAAQSKTWLDAQDAAEARLRAVCAPLMTMVDLRLAASRRFREAVNGLADMVPADDGNLITWRKRLDDFDHDLAALRAGIAPLDRQQMVSRADRDRFLPIFERLRSFIDADDEDLQRWSHKLDAISERIARVSGAISAVVGPQPEYIPVPERERIADRLAEYRKLVGDDDIRLKAWDAAINAAAITIAGARQRLAQRLGDHADGLLPQAIHAAFERDLRLLTALAGAGDADLPRYERALHHSRDTIARLIADCSVLEPGHAERIGVMAQRDLTEKVERLAAMGSIDAARLAAWRARLGDEARRVADLRTGLRSAFDAAAPITEAMGDDLGRLAADAPADDAEVHAWTAKRERVHDLQERIGAIDRKQPLPDDIDVLMVELAGLIGGQEPQLAAWRRRLLQIRELKDALRILDERRPFDAHAIAVGLAGLPALVGAADHQYQQWKAKADAVEQLLASLAPLPSNLTLGDHALESAHRALRHLVVDLIGPEDPQVRILARRLMELDGPPRPVWARDMGRDEVGLWAEAALPGGTLRFRYLASGSVLVGSPEGEAGRDADELQVPMVLPQGFWIADVETPRGIWSAIMHDDPSRTPLSDPALQPVERMSWSDAVRFCSELAAVVPRFPVRLPWEAEWEYACRAGSPAAWTLPDGSAISDEGNVGRIAWHQGNAGEGAMPSRSRLPNPLGLYDLHGNLAEWCADASMPYPTTATIVTGPATGGGQRILRGGSWGDTWLKTRAANRISADPGIHSAFVGLRLVVAVDWCGRAPDGEALLAGLSTDTGHGSAPHLHQVAAGDTLATIAAAHLGDATAWPVLIAANTLLDGTRTPPVGSWLVVPVPGSRSYRIREGDTLQRIATAQMGDPSTTADILAANPWLDGSRPLPGGRLLLLPPARMASGGNRRSDAP